MKPSFASTVEIPAAFDRELQRVQAEAGTRRIIQKKKKWSVGVLSAGLFDPPAAFGRGLIIDDPIVVKGAYHRLKFPKVHGFCQE